MSERPFMQLYVSDFIGDTLHLSTEQIGAYMLLLMAMWNAGGGLPDDETKLARVVRMSVKKWRAVSADLMAFFEVDGGKVSHHRLTKELQKSEGKSQSRAAAGAKGGAAKALKDKAVSVANATAMPQHLPDTITRDTSSLRSDVVARAKKAARLSEDWQLPPDWREDAIKAGLPEHLIDSEAQKMRDWSRSSPKGAKTDWRAMWRNWCRSAVERLPQARGSPQPRHVNPVIAAGEDMIREIEARRNARPDRDDQRDYRPLVSISGH